MSTLFNIFKKARLRKKNVRTHAYLITDFTIILVCMFSANPMAADAPAHNPNDARAEVEARIDVMYKSLQFAMPKETNIRFTDKISDDKSRKKHTRK